MKTLMNYFSLLLVTVGLSSNLQAQSTGDHSTATTTIVNATIELEKADYAPPSGLGGPGLGFEISAFPNPGNGTFTLSLAGNKGHQVVVTDLYGNRHHVGHSLPGQTTLQIELGNSPAGIYRVLVDEYSLLYRKL